jgi:DNA-binding MarR family transcriptional regulator
MDELTPEQKKLLESLEKNEAFELLQKMTEEIVEETKKQIVTQAENYSAVKSHGYTIYEIF